MKQNYVFAFALVLMVLMIFPMVQTSIVNIDELNEPIELNQLSTQVFWVYHGGYKVWYYTSPLSTGGILHYSWQVIGGDQSNLLKFYIVDQANFDKLKEGQSFLCYNPIYDAPSGSGNFYIPHTSTWYLVFDMRDSWVNDVLISATMSYTPPDTTPPTVSITSPTSFSTVRGTVLISISASDASGINRVEFYIDSVKVYTDYTASYSYSWDTTTYSNESHTISVKAYDTVGNSKTVYSYVTVDNSKIDIDINMIAIIVGIIVPIGIIIGAVVYLSQRKQKPEELKLKDVQQPKQSMGMGISKRLCVFCGNEVSIDSQFCIHCGKKV